MTHAHLRSGPLQAAMTRMRCRRCFYDETTPAIRFDAQGICNYCMVHDCMDREHPTGAEGKRTLTSLVESIRREGKGKAYDVVVGVSGGTDSSYLLYLTKELGLRPLAVHFDNTWNSGIAVENIHRMLSALHIPLETHVVDNREYDDICRAFLLSGVRDVDAPTDIGLAATLYRAAETHGIRTIFEGHSFRTEGIAPLGWLYMDGRYMESVVRRHGHWKSHRFATYPNMRLWPFLRWTAMRRIRKIRPLYYVDYSKKDVQRFLAERFGWKDYGGHHLENRFTAFFHTYLLPRRFGVDARVIGWSALVRSGQISRDEGLRMLANPPEADPDIIALVKTRLRFSDEAFEEMMCMPQRSYRDFPTDKKTFERLRPLFWLLSRWDLVPKSFYIKYTSKNEI